jgi:hypothetical protein
VAAFDVEQRVIQAVGNRAEAEDALDGAGCRGDVHFRRRVLHIVLLSFLILKNDGEHREGETVTTRAHHFDVESLGDFQFFIFRV